jgi:predicted GNAT family N-acyltransferase
MAVLAPWRKRGVGQAILGALLEIARERGCRVVVLHAQTHAVGFYKRFGFSAIGAEFEEAGIAHRVMKLALDS